MYNFDILVKKDAPVDDDDVSFEEVGVDIATIETPDVEQDYVTATLCGKFFDDFQKASQILSNVRKHLVEKGCTEEIATLMNPQLAEHGIVLEVGRKDEAMYSIEALSDKINMEKIKETMLKIIDAIINIIQKYNDHNKKDTNALKALINGRLSDISKVDTNKFASVFASIYKYNTYMELVKQISSIKLVNEIEGKESLSNGLSNDLKGLFKLAGYRVSGDAISRDPDFTIEREKMQDLGWEPSKIRNAAQAAMAMLQSIRRSHRNAVDDLKAEVKSDVEGEAREKLQRKLSYTLKTMTVLERISLLLSRQVIMLSEVLKDKSGSTSTEGLSDDSDKKPCKKKKHVAGCPCMDKDATSYECDCPFEDEEEDDDYKNVIVEVKLTKNEHGDRDIEVSSEGTISIDKFRRYANIGDFMIEDPRGWDEKIVFMLHHKGHDASVLSLSKIKKGMQILEQSGKLTKATVDKFATPYMMNEWKFDKDTLMKMKVSTIGIDDDEKSCTVAFQPMEVLGWHNLEIEINWKNFKILDVNMIG